MPLREKKNEPGYLYDTEALGLRLLLKMEFGPGVSELSSLSSAEDTALLENTRQRYDASHIYTRSGRLLLAVNPYRKLNCYTDKVLEQYKASLQPQAELPPHVYAVASSAHLGMMQNSQSQVRRQGRSLSLATHWPQNSAPQNSELSHFSIVLTRRALYPRRDVLIGTCFTCSQLSSPASLVRARLRLQRSFCNTWLKSLLRGQISTRAFCRPTL